MVELRRWLLNSSPGMSLFGALLLTGLAGCQSTRDYAASVDSSSQWSAPTTAEPEPLPTVTKVKPQPVAPYEEPIVAVPGPEALFKTGTPAPAPAADMDDEVTRPVRRRKNRKVETVTVDDVAPAPEPSLDTTPTDTAAASEPNSSPAPESVAAETFPALTPAEIASQEDSDASPSTKELTSQLPPLTPVTPQLDLPMPETTPESAITLPESLPANAPESSIPGLQLDAEPTPVEPSTSDPADAAPRQTEKDGAANFDDARVRPLFPETQPIRTVVREDSEDTLPAIEQARSKERIKPAISLPAPMPVTSAVAASDNSASPIVVRADAAHRVQTLAQVDSEVVGIAFDQHGNLLVASDEGLSRMTPTGSLQGFAAIESPRGFASLPDGTFAVCDARQRSLLQVDSVGNTIEILAQRSDGHFLRAPSFVAADADGGVYFTDPGYARITTPTGRLHYVSPEGDTNLLSQRLAYPQGVALSVDGAKLFLVESQNNRVVRFDLLSAGRVGPAKEFCKLPPKSDADANDFAAGLALDRDGRMFVARHGMQRVDLINADGQFARSIRVPNVLATSLVLSQDQTNLFVAGAPANAQWSGVVVRVPVADLGQAR